jgi:hypothetical protein
MVRIAPIRVISFLLLAACGALCQSERPSADLLQWDGSNSLEVQRREMQAWRALPDAPSLQPSIQEEKFLTFFEEAHSPVTPGTAGINAGAMGGTELGNVTPELLASFTAPRKAMLAPKRSSTFFDKCLYPSLLEQKPRYHSSTSGSFMGRASYAASRIFVTRDESGKRRVNTSYFLGVLTSVAAADAAYRPYWARSASTTFSNFGSTIGSDAGINLFHEFGPGIRQIVKGHTPRFVSQIEQRITHDQTPLHSVSTPAR